MHESDKGHVTKVARIFALTAPEEAADLRVSEIERTPGVDVRRGVKQKADTLMDVKVVYGKPFFMYYLGSSGVSSMPSICGFAWIPKAASSSDQPQLTVITYKSLLQHRFFFFFCFGCRAPESCRFPMAHTTIEVVPQGLPGKVF